MQTAPSGAVFVVTEYSRDTTRRLSQPAPRATTMLFLSWRYTLHTK